VTENIESKICRVCKEDKPLHLFNKRNRSVDGKDRLCKKCHKQQVDRISQEKLNGTYQSKCRKRRLTDAEQEERRVQRLKFNKQYRKENKDQINSTNNALLLKSKIDGIQIYGGKCQCCGESNIKFLTLEHLSGRDKTKKRRTGKMAWNIARLEGYPDTYTVLCYNCNCAKGVYGICPHQEKEDGQQINSDN